jgi:hypothetical protein
MYRVRLWSWNTVDMLGGRNKIVVSQKFSGHLICTQSFRFTRLSPFREEKKSNLLRRSPKIWQHFLIYIVTSLELGYFSDSFPWKNTGLVIWYKFKIADPGIISPSYYVLSLFINASSSLIECNKVFILQYILFFLYRRHKFYYEKINNCGLDLKPYVGNIFH